MNRPGIVFKCLEILGAMIAFGGIVSSMLDITQRFYSGYVMIAGVIIFTIGIIGQKLADRE